MFRMMMNVFASLAGIVSWCGTKHLEASCVFAQFRCSGVVRRVGLLFYIPWLLDKGGKIKKIDGLLLLFAGFSFLCIDFFVG